MRCAECLAAGKVSRVYPGYGAVTCMGYQPYWDEQGVYHVHDPNWHGTSYRCSEGHEWHESHLSPCPADGCDWASEHEAKVLATRERMAQQQASWYVADIAKRAMAA